MNMETLTIPGLVDKQELRELISELNRKMGFKSEPDATGEKSQNMMLALGIRPEDNIGSCGIIAAREEI